MDGTAKFIDTNKLFFVLLSTTGVQVADMWETIEIKLCQDFLMKFEQDE